MPTTLTVAKRPAPAPQAAPPGMPPLVAIVGGRPITEMDYDRVAQPYFQSLRAQLGGAFSPDMEKMARFNVLDELVRRELLALEAQKSPAPVSQAEIDDLLSHDPLFATNGKFDPAKLAEFKSSPTSNYQMVLPRVREMAAMRRLDESLRKRFTPTPAQVKAEWAQRNERVRFSVLPLLTRDVSLDGEASEAECAAYYAAHPDQFMRRTRVHLRYVRLPLPADGDSTRPAAEKAALASAKVVADSLRAHTLADTNARLADTGPLDLPAGGIPGIGRLTALSDTLGKADTDSTIRVVGPYTGPDAVVVGVITDRQGRHVPPLHEVLGDVKRRADADKRRTVMDSDRRAYYAAHLDRWKSTRITVTRVSLPGAPSADAALAKVADGWRAGRDARALAKAGGAMAETLSYLNGSFGDTVFTKPFVDSLLASPFASVHAIQGPRTFGSRRILWRIDSADTAFVPAYDQARSRSDMAFADERRVKDEADGRAFYDSHRGDYRTPERFAIDYIAFPVPPADSVKIPESELRHEYDANPAAYQQDEEVHARHILFMTRGVSPEADAKLKARADSLLAAIRKNGGDFTALAKRFSQEPGAEQSGGDLGWFGHGRMVKEFEKAAFALKPGEISAVVQTQFGYHIIKLEERHDARTKPFDEVRGSIHDRFAQSRADSLARRSADSVRRKLALGGDAAALAAAHGGVQRSTPFGAMEPIPGAGFAQGLGPELATMKPGAWAPNVYRVASNYVVVRLREKVAPGPASYDEVKGKAIEDAKNDKRRAILDGKVATIRTALAGGASLDSVAAPFGGLKDSGVLTRGAAYVPMLGAEPRVVEKAFAMAPGATTDTLQVGSGVAWVRVEEKPGADAASYKAESAQIEAEILKKKYDAWVEEKKKLVKIQVLRPDLKGPRPAAQKTG
jgi:parvulin-like peptidyl-prolyl isomerase